jgi:hypothetical protein
MVLDVVIAARAVSAVPSILMSPYLDTRPKPERELEIGMMVFGLLKES